MGRNVAVSEWVHLARRFAGSLRRGGPAPADDAWATSHLLAGEMILWRDMSDADRRHAVGVARTAADALRTDATRPVVAAALLHDVGKVASDLGPYRRAMATLAGKARGRDRVNGRFGQYLRHDVIGADLLAEAGSDGVTVAWAREHHLAASRWTIDPTVASALKMADDD
jgi:HD domain